MEIVNSRFWYFSRMENDRMREAICSQVARIIRDERIKRGMAMSTLARRAGLSQAMISFVEREVRNPSLDTLLRIAGALRVDLSEVIAEAHRIARTSK
jgi:transcriptional regulator with XRE-family HTH domain